ncbi:very short patch repair endonuclease [Qipengyuania sp. GH38]|nr:very short patch repair endonuclease [Qipengyuania intermedia]
MTVADSIDPAARSRNMSRITGKNTGPEVRLRSFLHGRGLRFSLHAKDLPGKPDIVLRRWSAAIFVDGCFWHRHKDCRYATTPSSNVDFWIPKFEATVARDARQRAELTDMGWRVAVFWACATEGDALEEWGGNLIDWIKSGSEYFETDLIRRKDPN